MRGGVCFRTRSDVCTGAPEVVGLSELGAERGTPARADHWCGFFDFVHNQRGVAPNGIELHPVLDVEFR